MLFNVETDLLFIVVQELQELQELQNGGLVSSPSVSPELLQLYS